MGKQYSTTEPMTITGVKDHLSNPLDRVDHHGTRILVKKDGVPVASIVPVADLTTLDEVAQYDQAPAEPCKPLVEFAAGFADQSVDEIEREADRALAEVRAERPRLAGATR